MSIDLTGITNKNEYYTNHYFSTIFEENAGEAITAWAQAAKSSEEIRTPWAQLRQNARQFYPLHDRYAGGALNLQLLAAIRTMADRYLASLGYPEAAPELVPVDASLSVPVYLEMKKSNGAPLLWVMLSASRESDAGILESNVFDGNIAEEDAFGAVHNDDLLELKNEDLATQILFGAAEPPRFLLFISLNQIALIDRNKWSEKRYLQFELEDIFSRLELTTLQAMVVLLHKDSLCPEDGSILLDELNEQSQKNAAGVSQDLKYALRECIELLGNEVLHDMRTRQKINLEEHPVDAGQLTLECLRYMYRMLFILFIEARPELGYAPIRELSYLKGYSLESLRDIADAVRDDVDEVGDGYYLHETLAKLYDLIYNGYPETEAEFQKVTGADSIHDVFLIAPLKAHIFDPEYTKLINAAKLRNSCMLRIIDLMSLTRASGKRNSRRGRISYANLGINQMGAVYEALLSYRGFIAQQDLYEVKRAGVDFNELDVGYFVSESDLAQYTEEERVRYASGNKKGKLRMYAKGTFIYRLAGREREKSASYYTPEVLTKCLVKYALKELLKDKSADDILHLTICEPAMGSAAFLNEAINQLAEAYISRKEQETGEIIGYEDRFNQLQKVKMFIADRNVYGVDLNPVAVELAEVSLWLNTIYPNGFVPWFGTQLVNGNSLIGARRQCYRVSSLQATSKGLRWYEKAPERVPLGTERKRGKLSTQIYHFLLGNPGMCSYTDKVIRQTALENAHTHSMYFAEYEMLSGEQNFLNAVQNYLALKGQQTNLFKCFLPLSWEKTNESGIAAFVHPEGVYDDPKGGPLMVSFDTISNLYDAKSIVECYQGEASAPIPGIKDANGDWNITGHPDRIIHVTQRELEVFAKLFDGNDKWPQARLPVLHVRSLIGALSCIASQTQYISDIKTEIFGSEMWHETNAQKDGTMVRNVHFPESLTDMIISGPHIAVANPCFKTSRSICRLNSDYDNIDLTSISDSYLQRCNYQPYCAPEEYEERAPLTPWNCKNYYSYRIAMRNMFNQGGERTLMSAIIPPKVGHVHAVYELGFKNDVDTALMSGLMESIPYDFYIKATGKGSGGIGVLGGLPIIRSIYSIRIILTTLLLNSLNEYYAPLWKKCWNVVWPFTTWSKSDPRLSPARFTSLTSEWTWDTPLRTDYERRQALVEIDVLTAMALGMTLQQLKTIYRIQFPVLQSYEADTWYDANGRITFTNNRSLTGVGFTRPEWENAGAVQPIKRGDAPWDGIMKHAPAGYVFARTITDDTMPGGPVQRTIEYAAPFDRCDREQDYETAWKFFEEKYKE